VYYKIERKKETNEIEKRKREKRFFKCPIDVDIHTYRHIKKRVNKKNVKMESAQSRIEQENVLFFVA